MFIGIGKSLPQIADLPGPSRPGYPSGSPNFIMEVTTTATNKQFTFSSQVTTPSLTNIEVDFGDGTSPVSNTGSAFSHTFPDFNTTYTIEVSGEKWWLEVIREVRRPLVLFGAGHVGQAVIRALSPLPFSVTWVDSRPGVFPGDLPGHIRVERTDYPVDLIAEAPAACIFIVMTHSHQLDEDICFEVLQRDDFAWLGLIGSETKRRRFVHRLEQRGIESARLEALVCPIGLAGIRGKQPATIALSLAAQLMSHHLE